eukprot:Anaeramoba_ignava/a355982_133.p1 GENE.a355982_133~~a355982_133.p1  ORF type:complete len:661 (-),score=177.44 a355982_133:151-1962(-)
MEFLIKKFLPCMDFQTIDAAQHPDFQCTIMIECLKDLSHAIRNDESGKKLKNTAVEVGIIQFGTDYILRIFPPNLASDSKEWKAGTTSRCAPYILGILAGLARNHELTQQKIFESGIIESLIALEKLSTQTNLGTLSENVLDICSQNNKKIADHVNTLRKSIKEKQRKKAMEKRAEMLRQMGFQELNSQRKVAMPQVISKLDATEFGEIVEEKGLKCSICQEGKTLEPEKPLGFYIYSKRMPLEPRNIIGFDALGISSVTQFNLIHFSCHHKAAQVDSRGEHPKREWDGAYLRNSQVLCNNLFPILLDNLPEQQYLTAVETYWSRLEAVFGSSIPFSARSNFLLHDLKFLLLRFARQESFSIDAHGGSPETNILVLPFMLQMANFLLHLNDDQNQKDLEPKISRFLEIQKDEWIMKSIRTIDNVLFYSTASLLMWPLDQWNSHRLKILEQMILYSYVCFAESKHTHSHKPKRSNLKKQSTDTEPDEKQKSADSSIDTKENDEKLDLDFSSLFQTFKPILNFFALLNKIHFQFKSPSGSLVQTLNTTMSDPLAVLDTSKVILKYFQEEILVIEDILEFLDVLGLLQDVLKQYESVEKWIEWILK